jgi:hypothetical protein
VLSAPVFTIKRNLSKGPIGLGAVALQGTGYKLRRWAFVRLDGAVAVSRIELSNPVLHVRDSKR